jgi:hypothetical protein
MMANPIIYSTTTQMGIDINNVFLLDTKTYPEYPAPPFYTGEQAWGTDGSAWVYCTASQTLSAGMVVIVSEVPGSWSVAPIGGATVATAPTGDLLGVVGGATGSVGVPAPTGTQTGAYFWLQRSGNAQNVKTAATTTKDAQLYSSPTVAGQVTSSAGGAGTTYQVNGLVISQATGSAAGPNTGILNWPVVGTSA